MSLLIILATLVSVQPSWAWFERPMVGPPVSFLEPCGLCDLSRCVEPTGCTAGTVYDRCGCCKVCGLEQSHLCNLESEIRELAEARSNKPWHGRCVKNLECRLRNDVDEYKVGRQSICYCKIDGFVCGDDGITYTPCEFEAKQSVTSRLVKVSNTPCKAKPDVTLTSESSGAVKRGSKVTLTCQAVAYPRADIKFYARRPQERSILLLPDTSNDVTVTYRGGDLDHHMTAFLQIINFALRHEGNYTCTAENELGMNSKEMSLVVV